MECILTFLSCFSCSISLLARVRSPSRDLSSSLSLQDESVYLSVAVWIHLTSNLHFYQENNFFIWLKEANVMFCREFMIKDDDENSEFQSSLTCPGESLAWSLSRPSPPPPPDWLSSAGSASASPRSPPCWKPVVFRDVSLHHDAQILLSNSVNICVTGETDVDF